MNEKLLSMAKEAGFDVSDGQISQHGMDSDLILNGILTKFAELVQADLLEQLKVAKEALQGLIASVKGYRKNICDNQPCDAEVFAKQALEKIGES